jgi:D-alanyl-D-alanine carboxypeptidase
MQPAEIASAAARGIVERGIVGAVVGIRLPDGEHHEAAAGIAGLTSGTSVASNDQFRVASITKTFVFAAVLRLHDEGRLDIEEPIRRWLPDLPFADRLTLRHVLMQTGGLPVWATDRVEEIPPAAEWSPKDVIEFHYRMTPPSQPGGPMVYANVGSRLAAYVAEQAADEPIAKLVQRSFLEPLALRDTIATGSGTVRPPRLTRGYACDGSGPPRDVTFDVPPAWLWAGGDMVSTAADLTRWGAALLNGEVLGPAFTTALRTELTPGQFHGSTMSHHGLGVMAFTASDGSRVIGYRGTTPGFVSILGVEPERRIAITVLTNSFSPDPYSIYRAGVEHTLFTVLKHLTGRAQ